MNERSFTSMRESEAWCQQQFKSTATEQRATEQRRQAPHIARMTPSGPEASQAGRANTAQIDCERTEMMRFYREPPEQRREVEP